MKKKGQYSWYNWDSKAIQRQYKKDKRLLLPIDTYILHKILANEIHKSVRVDQKT